MKVHDDGPDQTQNNGRLAVHDVRDIDVDQFDLHGKDVDKDTDVDISLLQRRELKPVLEEQKLVINDRHFWENYPFKHQKVSCN